MINLRKTKRAPFEQIKVGLNEIAILHEGEYFLFTEDQIDQHLAEGWGEDESAISSIDNIQIELYPRDYRAMKRALHPFGR